MDKEWTDAGCTHWQEIDITAEVRELLRSYSYDDGHTYQLVIADGIIRLDECGRSGGATVFTLPPMNHCPRCGAVLR